MDETITEWLVRIKNNEVVESVTTGFKMYYTSNIDNRILADNCKETQNFISRKFSIIQNIYFVLMVSFEVANTELEISWGNHASNIFFSLLLWQLNNTTCVECAEPGVGGWDLPYYIIH